MNDFSAKILAMIVSLRHLLGWLVSSVSCRWTSSSKTWPSVAGAARATTMSGTSNWRTTGAKICLKDALPGVLIF